MSTWDSAAVAVVGASVVVIREVVTLVEPCAKTREKEAMTRKIELSIVIILDHIRCQNYKAEGRVRKGEGGSECQYISKDAGCCNVL